jgi:hypothetical protein
MLTISLMFLLLRVDTLALSASTNFQFELAEQSMVQLALGDLDELELTIELSEMDRLED